MFTRPFVARTYFNIQAHYVVQQILQTLVIQGGIGARYVGYDGIKVYARRSVPFQVQAINLLKPSNRMAPLTSIVYGRIVDVLNTANHVND